MFAQAKLADPADWVKPEGPRQREIKSAEPDQGAPQASSRENHKPDDLNCSNRPVRTRMPGGVGGDRSGKLTAPIPIRFNA